MPLTDKEIHAKGKELQKAARESASPTILLSLLNELKTGVVPTEATLRATSIGSIVNNIKKHGNAEVQKVASKIVTSWREAVSRDKQKATGATASRQRGSNPASPAPSSSQEPWRSVKPAERSFLKDKIKVEPTGNRTRDNCAGLIYNGLAFMSTHPPSKLLEISTSTEAALYKLLGPEDKADYKAKVRSLFQNLKANAPLRSSLATGQISVSRFVSMTDQDLKSNELKLEEKKLEDENMRVSQVSKEIASVTDTLTCPKCHKKEVSFYQAQTRSADEPMTTFCTCKPCGHQWRFS